VPPDRVASDPNYRNMNMMNVKGPLPLPKELIEKGGEHVKAIQNYNRQYMENLEEGLPAIPLKKKHSKLYNAVHILCLEFLCVVEKVMSSACDQVKEYVCWVGGCEWVCQACQGCESVGCRCVSAERCLVYSND